jgi:muramidase (phage lysozyme)
MSNTDAFLDTISACEGTTGSDGYRALFGYDPARNPNAIFDNGYIDHPRIETVYRLGKTSAAGRYQFEIATWDRLARKLWPTIAVPMFTPENQDSAALELVAEMGAMSALKSGDLQRALDLCASQWASLPSSTAGQPTRSELFAQNAFVTAGGLLA